MIFKISMRIYKIKEMNMNNEISIFSNLPNDLIMDIIKIEEERKKEEKIIKDKFKDCLKEMNYINKDFEDLNKFIKKSNYDYIDDKDEILMNMMETFKEIDFDLFQREYKAYYLDVEEEESDDEEYRNYGMSYNYSNNYWKIEKIFYKYLKILENIKD